jgi:hypothetical protein
VECYRQEKKLVSRLPELLSLANPTTSHLVANKDEHGKGDEFSIRSIFVHSLKLFLHAIKPYDMGPPTLTLPPSPKEIVLRMSITLNIPRPRPGMSKGGGAYRWLDSVRTSNPDASLLQCTLWLGSGKLCQRCGKIPSSEFSPTPTAE